MKSNVLGGFVLATVVFLGGGSLVLYGFPGNSLAETNTSPTAPSTESKEIPPAGTTGTASGVTSTTATFHGTILPKGTTEYWFEFSADPLMGAILNRKTPHVTVLTHKTEMTVSADVEKLSSHTTYYFRIVVQNKAGLVRGERVSFNTK